MYTLHVYPMYTSFLDLPLCIGFYFGTETYVEKLKTVTQKIWEARGAKPPADGTALVGVNSSF